MSFQQALSFVRSFTKFSNDYTFLSSISSIDFVNNRINIRSGYWKKLISFIREHFQVQQTDFGKLCYILKQIFIDRFSSVSANALKKYMTGKIYRSYFNFSNLIYYTHFIFQKDIKKRLKNVEKLRKIRYFEKKAKLHYQYHIRNSTLSEETQHIASPPPEELPSENDQSSQHSDSEDERVIETFDNYSISSCESYNNDESDNLKREQFITARQQYQANKGQANEELYYRRYRCLRFIYYQTVKDHRFMDEQLTNYVRSQEFNPYTPRPPITVVRTHEPIIGEFDIVESYNVYDNNILVDTVNLDNVAGVDSSNFDELFPPSTSQRPDTSINFD